MAWSDAARKASAEARRAHRSAVSAHSKDMVRIPEHSNFDRAYLARTIHSLRGGFVPQVLRETMLHTTMHHAAISTNARNAIRRVLAKQQGRSFTSIHREISNQLKGR